MAWQEYSGKTVVSLLNSKFEKRQQGNVDEETKAPTMGAGKR